MSVYFLLFLSVQFRSIWDGFKDVLRALSGITTVCLPKCISTLSVDPWSCNYKSVYISTYTVCTVCVYVQKGKIHHFYWFVFVLGFIVQHWRKNNNSDNKLALVIRNLKTVFIVCICVCVGACVCARVVKGLGGYRNRNLQQRHVFAFLLPVVHWDAADQSDAGFCSPLPPHFTVLFSTLAHDLLARQRVLSMRHRAPGRWRLVPDLITVNPNAWLNFKTKVESSRDQLLCSLSLSGFLTLFLK